MQDVFEICGTRIPLKKITNYRVMQREYIYRPAYTEKEKSFKKLLSSSKYNFAEMVPYAAVLNENEYRIATNNVNTAVTQNGFSSPAEVVANVVMTPVNFVKDVTTNVFTSVANILPFGNKRPKYFCLNLSGRTFETYLDDIPILVTQNNGSTTEVYKDDPIFQQIRTPVNASVQTVDALVIEADRKYLFFGNGIQIEDAHQSYAILKSEINTPSSIKKR